MRRTNCLTVEWRNHPKTPHPAVAEFLLDGLSLSEQCFNAAKHQFGVISPFGWTTPEYQREVAERLLLRRPAILPSGRRELLVCSLCADLGCGCISAWIESQDGYFLWQDLGYENNYDPDSLQLFRMGSFVIEEARMTQILTGIIPNLSADHVV